MNNWNILVKVCDKAVRDEHIKDKNTKCGYMSEGCTTKYTTYLHNILAYNSRDYNTEHKAIYWIKE